MLNTWRGSRPSRHRLTRIAFKVRSVEVTREVAVAEKMDCPALLGVDLGDDITVAHMQHIIDQSAHGNGVPEGARPRVSQQNEPVGSGQDQVLVVAPVRGTRAETAKELKEIAEDESASALHECRHVELSDELDFPVPVVTPVEELCTLPEGGEVEIPLPNLVSADSDRGKLVAEQQSDKSLEHVLSLARKVEKGYGFDGEVLVQYISDSLGDVNQRVVVPMCRRNNALELAHSNLVAGHFGYKKTFARIRRHFLWPRMWVDVKTFVRSCASCQRAARNDNARVLLQPLPCVSEPFEKVAFDLMGP